MSVAAGKSAGLKTSAPRRPHILRVWPDAAADFRNWRKQRLRRRSLAQGCVPHPTGTKSTIPSSWASLSQGSQIVPLNGWDSIVFVRKGIQGRQFELEDIERQNSLLGGSGLKRSASFEIKARVCFARRRRQPGVYFPNCKL